MKKHVRTVLNPCLIGALLFGVGAQAALSPANLRCGMRVNPLGIGDTAPRLSWQFQSDGQARGEIQSAYQIQVGSAAGAADLWDSGKVISAATADLLYRGQPLTSGKLCYWRVRIYDGSNNVSSWSTNAIWSMGLLSSTNWSAQWIGYDAAYNLTPQQTASNALFNTSGLKWISCPGQSPQAGVYQSALRKQVVLPSGQVITNAAMALYADNSCSVYVNGQLMTNAAARWEATARINVTPWLHSGTNLLALSATSGDAQQPASVIGRLVVQFASGSVSNIAVDTSWKTAQWPSGNWTQANYDDSTWGSPNSGDTPWGTPAINDLARVPAPYLRKSFAVGQAVTRATVYVTALGAYELHLNGQKVGNDVLTPGWTQFTKRVYYQTYDVTGLVQPGANAISAILGDGWYGSDVGFLARRLTYGGTPRFLAQLVLQLSDGSTQTVVSDDSWKANYGPIQWGDLMIGSQYDARLELPGWDTAAFNDSAWAPVVTGLSAATGGYTNVTTLVASMVSNSTLNFVANNTTMGGDPAYNIAKTLQITFSLGGTNQTRSYAENSTVSIGGGGQSLIVLQALYGNALAFPGLGGMQIQEAVTEPSRCLGTVAATNLTVPSPGCYTFDLGQNIVGWVQLNISGQPGDRVTVRHGEMLNPNGTVYTANLRGATATDFYIFGTNGTVTYEPRFTFHGFRYVEVRGLSAPPTLNAVTGIAVYSDMPRTGQFACSSPLVNQLFSNIIWGQKGNYLEVPTDCPQRDERLGWSGDTEFFVPTAAYNFDVQSFFRRHMVTFCDDSQFSDGSYCNVAPPVGGGGAAAWGDAGWICPYIMYQDYGDTNILADHYASFKAYGQFLAAHASNYVISSLPSDFGDWLNLGGGATGKVIDTAFYAYYAQATAEIAAVLGNSADAASYAALHENIAAAFAGFFNADGSFTDGSSQTGYALAFTLDLVPPALRAAAAKKFADSVAGAGNHLATGFIGTPRLLPALHLAGRDDLAYAVLLQQTYPSWLYQVTLGATTMWERWDGWTPSGGFQTVGMNSFNHYSFGAVGEYLYGAVGGITPASPGYKTIRIQPVVGDGLTWAHTDYNSVRGLVSTAWTNTGSQFNLETVIPPNTTAQVYILTTNTAGITENGVPAASAPGVTYVGTSNSLAVFNVGSGHYYWSSPYSIPVMPGVIVTSTNQTGTNGIAFTPSWSVVTNGSLLAGLVPTGTNGNFNQEPQLGTRSVNTLTAGGNPAVATGGSPNTTSPNYVTCGNNGGATAVCTLAGSPTGYDLTNIVVYGGWGDNGRDQQAYTIYYSTVQAPATFVPLTAVNFNPSIANNTPSATRVGIRYSDGVLASNVAALKFDFSSPASENGYCGYFQLTAFGSPAPARTSPPLLLTNTQPTAANMVVGGQVAFNASFSSEQPLSLQWQKVSGGVTNTISGATGPVLTLANLQLSDSASYQLMASNTLGVAWSSPARLTVSALPAAVGNVITATEYQTGLGGNTFYPTWTIVTNGSLIAGAFPTTATGDFSKENTGRNVNTLTSPHDIGLTVITGNLVQKTTSTNYVTCGNGYSAGSLLIYSLGSYPAGYNVTNITVYGGWGDNGRDQQACTVSYSTVAAPSNYISLTAVNFNPAVSSGIQSATRVALLPLTGALATNVASVKFDFTSPASENGFCGYTGIAILGSPNLPPAVPPSLTAGALVSGQFVMSIGSMVAGRNYEIQSATNLGAPVWIAEPNFVSATASAVVTNDLQGLTQKFYRVKAY